MERVIGLAHLTSLHIPPPTLIELASEAGCSFVGVRVLPATPSENRYPLEPGSRLLSRTSDALRSTGMRVLDIEALRLSATTRRDDWREALEVGELLGASVLNVIGGDDDRIRMKDNFDALTHDAAEHGIRASIEPISYSAIRTLGEAEALIDGTRAGIMLDVLHFVRGGGVITDLTESRRQKLSVIQICDGLHAPPTGMESPLSMPLNQHPPAGPREIESRTLRLDPGAGEFPLRSILSLVENSVPVSVEVPNVERSWMVGAGAHVAVAVGATKRLLA